MPPDPPSSLTLCPQIIDCPLKETPAGDGVWEGFISPILLPQVQRRRPQCLWEQPSGLPLGALLLPSPCLSRPSEAGTGGLYYSVISLPLS